jgi:riboflavin synthase
MFTGLVREIGLLRGLAAGRGSTRLRLEAPRTADELSRGDSLAVNGICLTVTDRRGPIVTVEAAAETRQRTTLPSWRVGERLHLEPALRAGDPLGGHLVLGHVDATGQVRARRSSGRSVFLAVGLPADLVRYLLPKGSVTVDGVSLTLDAGPFRDGFTVNIIPHTLRTTLLGELRLGRRVNLELDVLAKAAVQGTEATDDPRSAAVAGERPGGRPTPLTMASVLGRGFGRRGGETGSGGGN